MVYLKLALVSALVLLSLDTIWLSFIAKSWYKTYYAPWLRLDDAGQLQIIWWAAGLVYVLLITGLLGLVVPLANHDMWRALGFGALFGCITYGVYDFTCLAIFKQMPVGMAFVDWAWGTFVCAVSACITVWAHNGFKATLL